MFSIQSFLSLEEFFGMNFTQSAEDDPLRSTYQHSSMVITYSLCYNTKEYYLTNHYLSYAVRGVLCQRSARVDGCDAKDA